MTVMTSYHHAASVVLLLHGVILHHLVLLVLPLLVYLLVWTCAMPASAPSSSFVVLDEGSEEQGGGTERPQRSTRSSRALKDVSNTAAGVGQQQQRAGSSDAAVKKSVAAADLSRAKPSHARAGAAGGRSPTAPHRIPGYPSGSLHLLTCFSVSAYHSVDLSDESTTATVSARWHPTLSPALRWTARRLSPARCRLLACCCCAVQDTVSALPSLRAASTFDFTGSSASAIDSSALLSVKAIASRAAAARRSSLSIPVAAAPSSLTTVTVPSLREEKAASRTSSVLHESAVWTPSPSELDGRGRLSELRGRTIVSALSMQQIVANRLSATKFIEGTSVAIRPHRCLLPYPHPLILHLSLSSRACVWCAVAQKRLLEYSGTNRELAKANADEAIKSREHVQQRKVLTQRCRQLQELIAIHKDNAQQLTLRHDALSLQHERHTLLSQQERDRTEAKQRRSEAELSDLQAQLDSARDEVREERRMRRELLQRQSELDVRMTDRSVDEGRMAMVGEELTQARREAAVLRDRLDAQRLAADATQRTLERQREQLQAQTSEVSQLQQRAEREHDDLVAATAQLTQLTAQQRQEKVNTTTAQPPSLTSVLSLIIGVVAVGVHVCVGAACGVRAAL